MKTLSIAEAASALCLGQLVVYPTEGVYGLGCLPSREDALQQILTIKARTPAKGLILVASHWAQLRPYVAFETLTLQQRTDLAASWPGPITWILPCTSNCPTLVRGQHNSVAVRISAHPVVQALCLASESALVSTSANLSGEPPLRTLEACMQLAWPIEGVVAGALGGQRGSTPIFDGLLQQKVRAC